MVSTRRGTANAERSAPGMERPKPIRQASDTIHVLVPSTKKVEKSSVKQKVPGTPLNMALSGNISEHDLSLTSPSTGGSPEVLAITTPEKPRGSAGPDERTVSSALRRLAPKPFANMSGSCHNPIIVNETSSPPRRAARAPKRRHKHKNLTEPHQFIGNGYRDLYSYRVSKPAMAAMPANGSTFTGHQSHDIYRMMNAKITAAPDFSPNAAWGRHTLNVPFEVQYPLSAQVLAHQQNAPQYQSPYAQYHQVQASTSANRYPVLPSQNEDLLRRRAVEHIREYSRPSSQKRLPDAEPDEISDDEAEGKQRHARPQSSRPIPQSDVMPASMVRNIDQYVNHRPTIHRDPDPNLIVGHLIEQTSLITSLLQIYPHSTDRKGLRNDISMLVQVQNQLMGDWMKVESQTPRKRMRSNDDSTGSLGNRQRPIITPAMRIQSENDHTVRQALSANADMWQDGTGHGVADTFAVVPASSPATSSFNGKIAGPIHMLSSPITHGQHLQGKFGAADSVVETPTQSTLDHRRTVATHREMLKTPIHRGSSSTPEHMSVVTKDTSKTPVHTNHSSTSSADPATPTKLPPRAANPLVTPSEIKVYSQHNNGNSSSSRRSNHSTLLRPAPCSDDDEELHVPHKGDASSSFRIESSSDVHIRKPIFRFERRVAVDSGEERAGAVPTPAASE